MATVAALIEDLPVELSHEITGYLLQSRGFGSVAALAQCSRRLSHRVLPVLYHNVSRVNTLVGKDALIWAADNDEVETLTALLDNGVDPDARFRCAVPDSVRQDILASQSPRRRRLSPAVHGRLVASLVREHIAWFRRRPSRIVLEGHMQPAPLAAGYLSLYRSCMYVTAGLRENRRG
jgi:hypothetical protein